MYKKGYFFILDAFIAATIIFVSLAFVLNSDVSVSQRSRDYLQAETVTAFLLNTQIEDLDNSYVENLINDGTIKNPRNNIVQQLDFFYYNAYYLCGANSSCTQVYINYSKNLFVNVTSPIIAGKYDYRYVIYDSARNFTVYNSSIGSYNSSNFRLITKKISYTLINETVFFRPHIVEFALWQK